MKIKKGEFVGVTGSVGSGKSSLLSAILGELFISDGRMAISQVSSGIIIPRIILQITLSLV